jgi:hypothetical protein
VCGAPTSTYFGNSGKLPVNSQLIILRMARARRCEKVCLCVFMDEFVTPDVIAQAVYHDSK